MNLLIIGNISTGKTSVAQQLISKGFCTESEFVSIDMLRQELSDGTFAGEFKAWAEMLERVQHPSPTGNGIYEFSGTGKNAWFFREAIKYSGEQHQAKWATIYCLCDRQEILRRIEGREYNVPIPYKGLDAVKSMNYMSGELQKRFDTGYWNCPEFTVRTDQGTPEQCADLVLQHLS